MVRPARSRRAASASLALAVSALLGACAKAPADPGAAVDRLVAARAGDAAPGAAVIVIRDGAVLKRVAWGMADLERGVPIATDTNFRLASVSKQFTAMAIMLLAEEGRLAYDDPVVRFLPELSRFGDELTIRHLLTHTGGLPDYYDVMVEVSGVPRPGTLHALAVLSVWGEPRFAPGERYEYSNAGYDLLALVIERASGQSFAEFVEGRILSPLGMTGSVVAETRSTRIGKRAYGYRKQGRGYASDDDHALNDVLGSDGVYSSVEDLYRWDQALYGERLVSRDTLAEAFRPARLASGEEYPYGFGWSLGSRLGRRRLSHSGSWVGFRTFIARYPDDRFTVIVLSNLAQMDVEGLSDRIAGFYLAGGPRPTVIENASVLDGSGAPARRASVRIVGDRIAEVGAAPASPGDLRVDAGGLVLAPGFIDTHSHADSDLPEQREALAAVSQGITTAIVGQDGASPYPLEEFFSALEREGSAINLAAYAGFGTLRRQVLGEAFRRPAAPDEVLRMRGLLRREMAAGALGLSTGLEYDAEIDSTTEEVIALAREAAAHGGRYISHIRSEDRRFWAAVEEILRIGREAALPVQISHLKLAMRRNLGQTERLIGILEAARAAGVDVTADVYPYTYWESTLSVLFPDRDTESLETAAFALSEITSPERATLGRYEPNPDYAGKTLREVAALRGVDPATTLVALIREAEAFRKQTGREDVESVIATSMEEADVERLLRWSHTNVCTDGSLDGSHPRGVGAYPRFLGRYVRERGVVDLATGVHKATRLAAAHVGIRDRGLIAPGMMADLVLFDPGRVLDRATPGAPHALSVGIETVWVNGEVVYDEGRTTGRLPGRAIRRAQAAEPPSAWKPPGARGIRRGARSPDAPDLARRSVDLAGEETR